ncbi:MAG: 16S rRNA (uracil(1498)-N(3))-methyltransferase [Gammaproteobacteria bacterium]
MRVPRIHLPQPLAAGAAIELTAAAAGHVARVLRLKPGDPLVLFNGEGGEYSAHVEDAGRGRTVVRVGEFAARESESPLSITLAQAISRGERMDYTIQKAVELGVRAIVPLITERTVVQLKGERREKRRTHWQRVAASACEQCGRNRVPHVESPVQLTAWLAQLDGQLTGLLLDPDADAGMRRLQTAQSAFALLSGPEGGFSEQEVAAARRAGFIGVRLGPRVLRTETAAVAALASLQALWGDYR